MSFFVSLESVSIVLFSIKVTLSSCLKLSKFELSLVSLDSVANFRRSLIYIFKVQGSETHNNCQLLCRQNCNDLVCSLLL